ncbi:hypothetical protein PMNALOAF_2749 [Methylobacterium adhaesivum]|uniref:Phage tail protein n=1 Tax=Methylobacterium adhaesivum TaxID=333297 RepID=A0ABT8BKS4_9HYPH|nr:hypothetical protein [Methylobacterium adhaesivum]MDN3592102.1 hypothetical protein [Methylobacterium adhaesivum]GJD31490.1 hypothetical protein PMNALOAF_2749 [Methylobacterium adhaesivum]
MAKSVEDQLADIETALETVEQRGQRIALKDREIWRVDHSSLAKRAAELKREVRRKNSGGVRVTRIVPL